jgi:sulfite reductase (NADPH) flavoprotein alpha-component
MQSPRVDKMGRIGPFQSLPRRMPLSNTNLPVSDAVPAAIPQPLAGWNREHPYLAAIARQQVLNSADAIREVRHLELDLGDSDLRYEPGDTVGIVIENDPTLVAEMLAACGVCDTAENTALKQQLLQQYEITQVHPGFLKHYSALCQHPALAALQADSKALRSFMEHRQIIDVLREFTTPLSGEQLLSCLRQLQPRQYSIASSQRQAPNTVALTVGILRFSANGRVRAGAGSSYLAERVAPSQRLPIYFVNNPNFRLPIDPATPILMIGPGTGIAPFRAFLQERAATGATGKNWLFCGNRSRAQDFLYADELLAYQHSGLLTRLDLAFSRDQPAKIYVQHLLQQHAAEVFAWLQAGAYVYVCGDAKHMAEDVQTTLLTIIAEQGKLEPSAARQYLVKLRQEKRYQRDVY